MKTNQLKMGALLSYISMGLSYIVSIVYTPIMLRLLGQSEYGLYNLVASVVSYLGLLSFGFCSAYIRFYSRYKVKNDEKSIAKLNGMFLVILTIISFIALIAGGILILNAKLVFGSKLTANELSTAKTLMVFMIFNIAFSFPASIFNSYIVANEKYIFQNSLLIIKTLINPFVMLPVLLMGYKSIGMVIATTILTIIIEFVNIIFCFKKLNISFSFTEFDFPLMKEMSIFSSYIFLSMIIDQINWSVDKLLLGRFKGTSEVAVYGLAAQLNSYYLSISSTIACVFIPRVNRMVSTDNDNNKLTDLFIKVGRIQFILLSLIGSGLIFFGQVFINIWAGSNYHESYKIVLLLIIPVTIPLIQNLGIEIQKAKNMHKFRSLVYFFIAISNLFISIPLVKLYSGIGAALGTAISLLIGSVFIMNWYYHNKVGLNIKRFWSEIFKFSKSLLLPALIGILINIFINIPNIYMFILWVGIYSLIFITSMWFLGMNQFEKDLISNSLDKIIKRLKFS